MVLRDAERTWSTINVDVLDERVVFTRPVEPCGYSAEDASGRIARRNARWIPTTLAGWPNGA